MKTPKFWNRKNIISYSLLPLSPLYYLCYKIRCLINFKPYKSKIPIICVGNIVAGGSGKTPVAIEVAKILKKNNKTFCFLSKGYGGNFKGIVKLDSNSRADVVGDEPLLLFENGDVFVSKNRISGLKYINENYDYDYIIMDDGLQNPTFYKDKVLLVIDGNFGIGNGFILPAGALRELFVDVYKKIDVVILNNGDNEYIDKLCDKYNVDIVKSNIIAENAEKFKSDKYIAFCGLGRPEKFKKTLDDNGIQVIDFISFEDHHKYSDCDIEKMLKLGHKLITTKKDWVKLSNKYKNIVDCFNIFININADELEKILL